MHRVDYPKYKQKKEDLMKTPKKAVLNNVPPVPDPVEQERIWRTVKISNEEVLQQCFTSTWSDEPYLFRYWGMKEHIDAPIVDTKPVVPNTNSYTAQFQNKITKTNNELARNPSLLNDQIDQDSIFAEVERLRCKRGRCKPGYIVGNVETEVENISSVARDESTVEENTNVKVRRKDESYTKSLRSNRGHEADLPTKISVDREIESDNSRLNSAQTNTNDLSRNKRRPSKKQLFVGTNEES
jgi:hypothetical protein